VLIRADSWEKLFLIRVPPRASAADISAMTDRRQNIARLLRRRRIIRVAAMVFGLALLLCVILDRAGAFGYSGDDWKKFNRKSFIVARVISGDQLVIRDEGGTEHIVSLIGIDAPDLPDAHHAHESNIYLQNRTTGRNVTLQLNNTRSRDEQRNLLAYTHITDGEHLNLTMLREGHAYADRRKPHQLQAQFESAETEARKKPRGLWKELKPSRMPEWRREWLRNLRR